MAAEDDDSNAAENLLPETGDPDVESLRVTRTEARQVLNKQIEKLDHIDSKAAETLRLNIVILGVLLTLSSLLVADVTPEIYRFVNLSIGAGILFTFLSFVFAFWTYTSTRKDTGPSPADIERVRNREYDEKRWLIVLLRTYERWIARNERENDRDSKTLFMSHIWMFMAMGYYTFGILWGLLLYESPSNYHITIILGLLLVLPLVVLLPRIPPIESLRQRLATITDPIWERLYER